MGTGMLRDVLGDLANGLLHEPVGFLLGGFPRRGHLGDPIPSLEHEATAAADQPGDRLAAMGALLERRVGHPLLLLELPARGASIFISGHVLLRRDRSSYSLIIAHSP